MIEWLNHCTKLNLMVCNFVDNENRDFVLSLTEEISNKQLCSLSLNTEELNAVRLAIEEHYYFEFVVDDIPIRGFVGEVEETNIFPHRHHILVYTHYHFNFYINDNQVRIVWKEKRTSRLLSY